MPNVEIIYMVYLYIYIYLKTIIEILFCFILYIYIEKYIWSSLCICMQNRKLFLFLSFSLFIIFYFAKKLCWIHLLKKYISKNIKKIKINHLFLIFLSSFGAILTTSRNNDKTVFQIKKIRKTNKISTNLYIYTLHNKKRKEVVLTWRFVDFLCKKSSAKSV